MRRNGFAAIFILCLFYWVLDSVWSQASYEHNLKHLIFSEPVSWIDTFLLRVSPYQAVSRLMVVAIFAVCGGVILEIMIKRQRAEKQRKEAHDTLLTVLNSVDATVYAVDMRTYEILFMNGHMIESFGGDFTGKKCHAVFRNNETPCGHCTHERLLDESGNSAGPVTWEGQNPITKAWYMNYDRAIRWIDGRVVHLQIATDITELKDLQEKKLLAEARLQKARKMESIGKLAGGIAHDFNNILFPITGMAELLMEDFPPDSPGRECAEEIRDAGKRGAELVKQILAFSRQSENEKKPVRLQRILKEVLGLIRGVIPSYIEIRHDIRNDCGLVTADPTQMHQVAMNLVTNAFHALEPQGGEIFVGLVERALDVNDVEGTALSPARYAEMTVSDTGGGIDPEIMRKIFEPYFTTREPDKGTGLGLSVVYGIVRDHGGDIKVRSQIGKGASFRVYLPLAEKTGETETVEASEAHSPGTERVLLVDDDASIARLEKKMLERLGYKVTSRTGSLDALETFRAAPDDFDLVLTDMTMPNMTGDILAGELKAIRSDIPIVICTGFSERTDEEKSKALGIGGFLMKPVLKAELATMVRKVLDDNRGGNDEKI